VNTPAENDFIIRKLLKSGHITVRLDGDVYYKGRLCKSKTSKGYLVLSLENREILQGTGRKRARILLHRLVYQAYCGTLRKNMAVNHIDRDPSNNSPSNLELISQRANMKHWHLDNKVHKRHCYQGEYEDSCKYGQHNCPARNRLTIDDPYESMEADEAQDDFFGE